MRAIVAILYLAGMPQIALAQAGEDPLSYQVLLRMSGGLLLVVALVFVAAWGVRRFGRIPSAGNSTLQLLGGIAVGQRERVVLIRVGNERLLIGVAPGRVQMLHSLSDATPDTAQDAVPALTGSSPPAGDAQETFQNRLRGLLRRGGVL